MKKVWKIVILSVLILVLIAIAYFFYNKWQESKMGLVSFEKATEQKIDGKTYIENKEVGLKFAVPEGWEVKKYIDGVVMYSSDFVIAKENYSIPQSGCSIVINSDKQKEGSDYDKQYSYLKRDIADENLSANNTDTNKKEIIDISGLKGTRQEFFIAKFFNNQGNVVSVLIPYNDVVYSFETYLFGRDKDTCLQEFNNLLTTITIKK